MSRSEVQVRNDRLFAVPVGSHIRPGAAVQVVVAFAALEDVVAALSVKVVVPLAADQHVGVAISVEFVAVGRSLEVLDARQVVEARAVSRLGSAYAQLDHDAAAGAGVRGGIVAVAPVEGIVAFAALEDVVAFASPNRVVTVVADQNVVVGGTEQLLELRDGIASRSYGGLLFRVAQVDLDAVLRAGVRERVGAGTADQHVVAIAAVDGVVAIAAVNDVIAAGAEQGVVLSVARQNVVILGPFEVLYPGQRVFVAEAVRGGAAKRDVHRPRVVPVGGSVAADAAHDSIGAGTAFQVVISRSAVEGVIALAAYERILPRAAHQRVRAFAPLERVHAAVAQQRVVAGAAHKPVTQRVARELVVAGRAYQVLDSAQVIGAVAFGVLGAGHIQVDPHAAARMRVGGRIVAGVALQDVILFAALKRVVACAADQRIVARAADQ